MTTKRIKVEINTEQELIDKVKKISLENPKSIVTYYARFGMATIYIRNSQPRTDSADTTQTYDLDGGFWKNGKIIKPTNTWIKRYNFIPYQA